MDVQCERCKTEYEFEDALVSRKGTTVKCTNCGLQFKIRPSVAGATNEQWIVRSSDGTELVFTSLRDLQRAITQRQVGRIDTLRRGNGPPRSLGNIAELEPFFRSAELPVPASTGSAPGFPTTQVTGGLPPPRASRPEELPRDRHITLRPPSAVGAPPPPGAPTSQLATVATVLAAAPEYPADYANARRSSPRSEVHAIPSAPKLPTAPQGPGRTVRTAIPNHVAVRPSGLGPAMPPVPARARLGDRSYDDIDAGDPLGPSPLYSMAPGRRRMGGWVVALVLTVGVGLIGYRIGQPYLGSAAKGPAAPVALDPRAAKFLSDGEHALEEGNLDLAKENFDKASVLQEKDPRVLLDLSRLSAIRADVPWLRARLLPADAPEEDVKATKQQLLDLTPALRKAADDAVAAAPADPAAIRAKVDALRITGDVPAARALVAKMGSTSQPESLYVLAALDLGEIAPLWNTVIERLRNAAAVEGNLGRGRSALVYALAKSGDAAGAQAELARLSPRSPLASALRTFVQKPSTTGDGGVTLAAAAGSAATSAPVDVNSLPQSGGGAVAASGGGGGGSSDPRVLLQQAASAEGRGQLPRAAKLYEDALRYDANSSEALAGLGSVALKQGDNGTAKSYFAKALGRNPSYVPALVGQADAMWNQGDHAGAAAKYKDLFDRFPESSGYPSYVKTRAGAGAAATSGGDTPLTVRTPTTATEPPHAGDKNDKPGELVLPANTPSDLPGAPR